MGKLPTSSVDGRVLRALQRLDLVTVARGFVFPAAPAVGLDAAEPAYAAPRLNDKQATMLRMIVRSDGAVPAEELDGRTLNALISHGMLVLANESVTATDAGRAALAKPPAVRRRRGSGTRMARSAAIRRSADQLEDALPAGAEVLVGNIMAAAQDVVDGFRLLARRLEREPQQDT